MEQGRAVPDAVSFLCVEKLALGTVLLRLKIVILFVLAPVFVQYLLCMSVRPERGSPSQQVFVRFLPLLSSS